MSAQTGSHDRWAALLGLRFLLLPVLVAMMLLGPGVVASQQLPARPSLLELTVVDDESTASSSALAFGCHEIGDSFAALQCSRTSGEQGLAKQLRALQQLDEEDDLHDGIASHSGLEGRTLVAPHGPPENPGREAASRLARPPRGIGA